MRPPASIRTAFTAALAGALTVGLLMLCFPPFDMGWLAWFALAPVLIVIPRLSERSVEWLGFLTGFAFYAINFRWFYAIFGFPAVALWGILALFFAVFCVLVRSLPEKMAACWRVFLIPCFWVAVEYVRCEQWPLRFSWLALGYSQHSARASLDLAGIVGVSGLGLLLVAFAVLVAEVGRRSIWWATALAAGISLAIAPIYYVAVSRERKMNAETGRVVIVQSHATSLLALKRMGAQAFTGPSIPTMVVWPEYAIQRTPDEDPELYAAIRRWAAGRGVTLVFGGINSRGGDKYSSAGFVVGPNGKDLGRYEKHNPLPFFKDGEPGGAYPVFHWRVGERDVPFGVTICYDLSFERNARMLARNGARMLVVPSVEPSEWPRIEQAQHAIIAPMRAAENGIGIVRCSSPGPSQIVGPGGWVRRSLDAGVEGCLVDRPAVGDGQRTVYNRFGWLLPYACQAVTVGWIASRLWRRRRGARVAG